MEPIKEFKLEDLVQEAEKEVLEEKEKSLIASIKGIVKEQRED